jgi:ABC-type sulfate/molybdate transport systems ATPase subunit
MYDLTLDPGICAAMTSNQTNQKDAASKPRDRLVQVDVRGLFGLFDHSIPLKLDSRITVVHGPNGVGKTIVLRMIHELLSGAGPDVFGPRSFRRAPATIRKRR